MAKPSTAPQKPDGIITTQINNQTFIIEVFFNHDSKETFQDKLLRAILAENPIHSEAARKRKAIWRLCDFECIRFI